MAHAEDGCGALLTLFWNASLPSDMAASASELKACAKLEQDPLNTWDPRLQQPDEQPPPPPEPPAQQQGKPSLHACHKPAKHASRELEVRDEDALDCDQPAMPTASHDVQHSASKTGMRLIALVCMLLS